MLRHSLLVVALLSSAAPAAAWTYREYTGGTPIDAVKSALAEKGGSLELVAAASPSGPTDVYVVQPASVPVLTFCHGRLSGYSDRITGDISDFIRRAEEENRKRTSSMPRYRLDRDKDSAYELTEVRWELEPGTQLNLSWSAAGGTGIGLETVTQDCPEAPAPAVAQAAPADAAESVTLAPSPAQERPAADIAEAPGPAPGQATGESHPDADEALAGTLHTPGVDVPAPGEMPAARTAETAASEDKHAVSPRNPADTAAEPKSAEAVPAESTSSPASIASEAQPAPVTASAPEQADEVPSGTPAIGQAQGAAPDAGPSPGVASATTLPASPAADTQAPAADVVVQVPLPPEAPVVIAQPAPVRDSQQPSVEQLAVVVPPPPEVPPPALDRMNPDGTASIPAVANVPLPPPRPPGLAPRHASSPAVSRPQGKTQPGETGLAPDVPAMPDVIVPGTLAVPPAEPAAGSADAEFDPAPSPRPPANVGTGQATLAPPTVAVPVDGEGDSGGDGVTEQAQAKPAGGPSPESTSSVTRRWPPSTPEQCAAAFRSYDPVTRTYKAMSGARRQCP
jgi:hypothetical protein